MNGIDFNLRYRAHLGAMDTLSFLVNGTYLTSYQVAFTPSGAFKSLKNSIYNPLTFKARASVGWDHGPFNLQSMVTYIGGYKNDIVTPAEHVDSYTLVDLTLNWDLSDSFDMGLDRVSLGLEVRNLFNTNPPYVNSQPGANSGGGYDPTVTNPVGREFAVSLRTKL